MTTKLLATAFANFVAGSGTSYTADANGIINADAGDVLDLVKSGCTVMQATELSATGVQVGGSALAAALSEFAEMGTVFHKVGNPIASNAAATTNTVLTGFVLPANALDAANRGLHIKASGKFGATDNDKRIKIWANPTLAGSTTTAGVISGGTVSGVGSGVLLYDSGTVVGNAIGWSVDLDLFKYGAAASNTQYAQYESAQGTAHEGVSVPAFTTLVETAAINFVVTGSSLTTGAAADVVLNFFEAISAN